MWIVTCKHCVQDKPVVAIRMDTSGGTRVYTISSAKWGMHPKEDVAVTPLDWTTTATRSLMKS